MVEKDKISSEIKTKLEGAQERLELNTHLKCGRKSQKPREWKWDQKRSKKDEKKLTDGQTFMLLVSLRKKI